MKFFLSFLVFLATITALISLLFGGVFLGVGDLNVLENKSIVPDRGTLRTLPVSNVSALETGTETIVQFAWRGNEIVYDGDTIDEAEFVEMLDEARANEAKVEIIEISDVRLGTANRWRQLLDDAAVQYEVMQQE